MAQAGHEWDVARRTSPSLRGVRRVSHYSPFVRHFLPRLWYGRTRLSSDSDGTLLQNCTIPVYIVPSLLLSLCLHPTTDFSYIL